MAEQTPQSAQVDTPVIAAAKHDVPPENRAIETTRVAGEYVLPPKSTNPAEENPPADHEEG